MHVRSLIALTAMALLAAACGFQDRTAASAATSLARHFPNVQLKTQDNRAVRFYDDLVKGKVVLISFMFTSCQSVCPRATANILKVRQALGDRVGRDVFFYSVTLDPKRDTPAVLGKYSAQLGTGQGWLFLTGTAADIELLRTRLGVIDPDPEVDADRTQHGALLVYGNERTGKWSVMPALLPPELIVKAVLRVMS